VNIAVLAEMAADALGDRTIIGAAAGGATAAELLGDARSVAGLVTDLGVDRLAYVGENDDLVAALLFGAALAGRPYVPVSYRVPDDRLRAMVARLAPALAVVDNEVRSRLGDIDGIEVRARHELRAELAHHVDVETTAGAPEDPAVWLYTSGTTGEPKVAVLRHHHLSAYVVSTVEFAGSGPDEAALVSVPPYHVAGISAVLSGVYRGRRTVFLPAFDAAAWVEVARREAITHAMVVPTMLGRILEVLDTDDGDLPALRHLSYGGGRMPRPVIERALDRLPQVAFVNAYGLTETSSTIAVLGPDDHRAAMADAEAEAEADGSMEAAERLSSVGRPVPGVEVEVRAPDGTPVPAGDLGEVWVRGPQVSGEYLGADAGLVDGWFATRDTGRVDAAGYLYLTGRLDDVIVRGGENLSPAEIEEVLVAHPAVADAAVVGVPDLEWGERVIAVVVPAAGAEVDGAALRAWVRARLRSTRTPEHIEVRSALPYNETGKLLRRVLRDELAGSMAAATDPVDPVGPPPGAAR
jgi:acyl-CoA synthetase (AMP-forming)/AMP-acid ligase II